MMTVKKLTIGYDGGTLVITGDNLDRLGQLPGCQHDPRSGIIRAEARNYRHLIEFLRAQGIGHEDQARAYQPLALSLRVTRDPFPHQLEALEYWRQAGQRGVVVLPTGTGKTYLAILAIQQTGRPALVVTPTIDLLNQWYDELATAFGGPVGLLGGGHYEIQPITVTTYDSAYIHLERVGPRFGLLVFDECHHLPGPSYMMTAIGSIAPFRLGLTATPERADGQEILLQDLIGPIVYHKEIRELSGDFLAPFRVERLYVDLLPEEQGRYERARAQYRQFVQDRRISMSSPLGWRRFLQESFRSDEGRAAFQAYLDQKRLAQAAPAKLQLLERLLAQHVHDRILIFTYDNATVYQIARRFLVPAITHQTRAKERRLILQRFHEGEYPILVTSQVLNEGVDVPAANIGVILSGTGSVREHVQRLGRLLRKVGAKQALLYEIVTRDTAEEFTSERRRQHHAYR